MDQAPIPLLDLRAQYDTIRDAVEPAMREVVESQWFIGGPKLGAFEEAMCAAKPGGAGLGKGVRSIRLRNS